MHHVRRFVIPVLVLAMTLGGSLLLAAGKAPRRPPPPRRPAPKVHHPPRKPPPKPKHVVKKPVHHHPPRKPAPKPKPHVAHKVKPPLHHPKPHKEKPPKTTREHKEHVVRTIEEKRKRRIEEVRKDVRRFATFNLRREVTFNPGWWYRFVVYPTTVSGAEVAQLNYNTVAPPTNVSVTPPVVKAGQGLPISPAGSSLAALLDGMDVEHHWLAGRKVDWKTGNPTGEEGGQASNDGAFVAAVCARLNVPMPPADPENFLPGSQYDWLVQEGKDKGWVAVGDAEAQLLANQGWAVIAAWMDPSPPGERSVSGMTAIVRPDEHPAAEIPAQGPHIIMAGANNHNDIALRDGFPARAWKEHEVVFLAHQSR